MPTLAGRYLGAPVKAFINMLAVVLLLLVGVVFVASPAKLLSTITMDNLGVVESAGRLQPYLVMMLLPS